MKKLRKAKRGLTFSLDSMEIGSHYRYVVDQTDGYVLVIPDENGANTVSRKKSGSRYKPLVDIRSKEVRELVSKADYLELEPLEDGSVLVHCIREFSSDAAVQSESVVDIGDMIGEEIGQILVSKEEVSNVDEILVKSSHSPLQTWTKDAAPRRIYDVVSLFSGAGLLDYSFRDPQFRFVFGVDADPDACETYRHNIGNHIVCKDIRTVDASSVPACNLVIGGPCCQAYSNANRHNIDSRIGEQKRLLIDDYIRIAKAKHPEVFVIENVPQFLTKENGKYLKRVLEGLPEYKLTTAIVSDDAVGGYTIRRRAIIIGSRIGKICIPQTVPLKIHTVREAFSKVDSTWFNFSDVTAPRASTVEAMRCIPQGGNWQNTPDAIQKKHGWGRNTQSSIFKRLSWDQPSITITNWRKTNLTHPEENRILTVSEAAALMGLNKDFPIYGKTLNSRQQQVGNGVTQAIGRFVKRIVLKALNRFFGKKDTISSEIAPCLC